MKSNTKEWVQYGSALGMLVSGVVLTFICYFMHDDVTENILIYVAQCLVYAGGIFGVSIYVKSKIGEEMDKLKEKLTGKKDENK